MKPIKKIILIICDTLRAQNVGLYGANPSPTPNIDALGKKGVVFANAYATITKTDPSITTIMTGRYPLSNGLVNHGQDITKKEEKNLSNLNFLPEILKKHGFKTMAVDWLGRWHERGYDYYSGQIGKFFGGQNPVFRSLPIPFLFRILDKVVIKFLRRDLLVRYYYVLFSNPEIPYDTADIVVDKAIELLQKNKKKELFLYLHFWDAHMPHIRPQGLRSYLLDTVEDTYNAEIKFLDMEIGRLIDYLKKTNQLEETLIVLTSDHGENLYEHDIPLNHQNLYEDVVKIPLIFSHKSLSSRMINALVQHVDILPTLLDLLRINFDEKEIDGVSLMPIIEGNKKEIGKFVYFEDLLHRKIKLVRPKRRRGIRVGNYKYIETLSGKEKELHEIMPSEALKISSEELFNLKGDPEERNNLIKIKPKTKQKLKSKLEQIVKLMNIKRLKHNRSLFNKVQKSLAVIRKSIGQFKGEDIALAWTGGKDSTVLLHLVRMAFDGKIPFKVVFNDSTMEFKEIYEFIKKVSKLWNIDLITIKHSEEELKEFQKTKDHEKKKELSRTMKITAINSALKKYKIKAFMAGIRWDEHESRSKEKYFSPRSDHMRIHPILHFTEKDIWEYIKHFGVPYVDLYERGYRSLGEKPFTKKAKSGEGERSGREKDKEQLMERLRKMGYW